MIHVDLWDKHETENRKRNNRHKNRVDKGIDIWILLSQVHDGDCTKYDDENDQESTVDVTGLGIFGRKMSCPPGLKER